jgi:precorrin-6A/cobalt-precorrin-6A reductase
MTEPLKRALILGGTGEAARLADQAVQAFGPRAEIVTSLAGALKARPQLPGRVRVGRFADAAALAEVLRAEGIAALIDATHPFAATISAQAAEAAAAAGVPRLVLARPPWEPDPEDRWIEVDSLPEARAALDGRPPDVLLATGRKDLRVFTELPDFCFHVRLPEDPGGVLPIYRYQLVIARGPFTVEGEEALFKARGIKTVICKASGGAGGYAKIAVARRLGLPVVMVRRPPPPAGPAVATPEDALAWLKRALGT